MGINSGFCLAGNVGSRTRLKFTLLGDEINLAARLEGLCKHYGCYLALSDKTFAQPDVEKTFCCRVLDKVQLFDCIVLYCLYC
jgi:adenylate cyclase